MVLQLYGFFVPQRRSRKGRAENWLSLKRSSHSDRFLTSTTKASLYSRVVPSLVTWDDKDTQSPNKAYPQDLKKRAVFEQAASVEQSNFDYIAAPLVYEVLIKKRYGLETGHCKADPVQQKYLAGDELTLADLFHLPYGALLPVAGVYLIQERPNVARWFNELSSRPSWQAVKDKVESVA
ncbi:hypothetical protein D9756_011336 [Leucocoprinus leucothites]|uniref:glutathione transferase n=1 Tax=Leucocoprinus leucothites TaxID=201217 RepID=A0A8H5CM72_9AGAR|nr:hypothetical protein D9756_011336 [Leucoagaricus leucothites]